jgi:hypothetical protein
MTKLRFDIGISLAQAVVFAAALSLCTPAVIAEEANQAGQSATPAPEAKATKEFAEEDVDKRVQEVITERSKDGAFVFHDPKLDADLNLIYEQIKIVRGMEHYGWFANVIFHDKDEAKKQYAIDFWFKPEGDQLTLMDIRVQKGPKQDGDSYYMVTRMPVAWWWLPVQEHPGDMEVTRAWQVMSAIHSYIATPMARSRSRTIRPGRLCRSTSSRFTSLCVI